MSSVNLVTLEALIKNKESDLEVEYTKYEYEKTRSENSIQDFLNTKKKILNNAEEYFGRKLEEYDYKQQKIYRRLKKIILIKIGSFYENKILSNNRLIYKNTNNVINTIHALENSYKETLIDLENVYQYLVNSNKDTGYVELCHRFNYNGNYQTDYELINQINKEKENNNDNKKVFNRLVDCIKSDNNNLEEIKKIEKIIKIYNNRLLRLSRDVEYYKNYSQKTKEHLEANIQRIKSTTSKVDEIYESMQDIILNMYAEVDKKLSENIEHQQDYITKNKEKIRHEETELCIKKMDLLTLQLEQNENIKKYNSLAENTPSWYIDKVLQKNERTRKNIEYISEKIEMRKSNIKRYQNIIDCSNLKIYAYKKEANINRKMIKKFEATIKNDYNNIDNIVNKFIKGESLIVQSCED